MGEEEDVAVLLQVELPVVGIRGDLEGIQFVPPELVGLFDGLDLVDLVDFVEDDVADDQIVGNDNEEGFVS